MFRSFAKFSRTIKSRRRPANFDRFFAAYVGWLREMIVDCHGGACDGVLDFIRALEAQTDPPVIGLLTGNIKAGARIKLERFNLWEKFPFGGFADDDEHRDRIAAVAHAARQSNISGGRCAGRKFW